jgi:hypothetical protein
MKFGIVLFIAFISLLVYKPGYFEGKIHYEYEVKSKSRRVNLAKLQQIVGKGSTLLFKEGNFRHDYDGGMTEFDMYRRSDNRYYIKKWNNDTIHWYDCSKGGKSIIDLKVITQKKKVLGMQCDELTVKYSDLTRVEYYNSDSISVDPEWFSEFKRDDQHKIDAIQKSIFLRSESDFPLFTIISHASRIERQTVRQDAFEIPRNSILMQKN